MAVVGPRFSLLQLLEMVTLIGVTSAIDRWLTIPILVPGLIGLGGLTGAYLAIRWTIHRPGRWNDIWLAIGTSAAATFLNATATGIVVAERVRIQSDGQYWDWNENWLGFAIIVGGVTFGGTVVGVFIFAAVKFVVALPTTKLS